MTGMHSTLEARRWAAAVALVLCLPAAGCQTVAYYSHAALGQWRVLTGREPVAEVLETLAPRRDEDPAAALLYDRLTYSQAALDFAARELALDPDGRYRTYVHLDRPAVVWNLFAAPPLSLEPYRWCYPIVGCAPYRGYFDLEFAERRAAALGRQGLETYLGPVPAYSTLGWFDDPLLSTFITWPEADLAALLFHELAHGVVWASGDVAFNESFATFVGREGLTAWLGSRGRLDELDARREAAAARRRLLTLLQRTRQALQQVYASALTEDAKLSAKRRVLDAVTGCYADARERFGDGRYDLLMSGLDNARLVSVATYEDLVPAFAELFESVDRDWRAFYERVRALAAEDVERRRELLGVSGDQQVAHARNDHRADEVECQPLAGHLLDAEAAG
jgi:predicted aminopeptidase